MRLLEKVNFCDIGRSLTQWDVKSDFKIVFSISFYCDGKSGVKTMEGRREGGKEELGS